MKREKILLIDGHSILSRAFYGVPFLNNKEGIPTNGIYGFLNILFKEIELEETEYVAVAFDVPKPTFRHKLFPEYKGTRKGMPEELKEQVPLLQELLRKMHMPEELRITHMIYEGLQSLEGEQEELQLEKSYQNLIEEANFFIFQNHFFRGLRIVVHSLLFWAVFFSAWYSLYGFIG